MLPQPSSIQRVQSKRNLCPVIRVGGVWMVVSIQRALCFIAIGVHHPSLVYELLIAADLTSCEIYLHRRPWCSKKAYSLLFIFFLSQIHHLNYHTHYRPIGSPWQASLRPFIWNTKYQGNIQRCKKWRNYDFNHHHPFFLLHCKVLSPFLGTIYYISYNRINSRGRKKKRRQQISFFHGRQNLLPSCRLAEQHVIKQMNC